MDRKLANETVLSFRSENRHFRRDWNVTQIAASHSLALGSFARTVSARDAISCACCLLCGLAHIVHSASYANWVQWLVVHRTRRSQHYPLHSVMLPNSPRKVFDAFEINDFTLPQIKFIVKAIKNGIASGASIAYALESRHAQGAIVSRAYQVRPKMGKIIYCGCLVVWLVCRTFLVEFIVETDVKCGNRLHINAGSQPNCTFLSN